MPGKAQNPTVLGSRSGLALVAAFVAGVAVWAWCASGDADRAWRAMLVSFIFFTPMAAAMVTVPAIIIASRGEWSREIERIALGAIAFAPASLAALVALFFGRAHWAAWLGRPDVAAAGWLGAGPLFTRDLLALAGFWALAAWFVRRWPRRPKALAGGLIVVYGLVFTLLGFDLVMALDPKGYSALFGTYFFVAGVYAAVAAWTLLVIARGPAADGERFGDLGKMVVLFSLLTAYTMFSQLIVMWYENLPAEARTIVPRLRFNEYGGVSVAIVAIVYLGPLVLLLGRRAKRNRVWLAAVCVLVLAGLWLERAWLVAPALKSPIAFGLPEIAIAAGFAAALGLGLMAFERRGKEATT